MQDAHSFENVALLKPKFRIIHDQFTSVHELFASETFSHAQVGLTMKVINKQVNKQAKAVHELFKNE